MFRPIIDRLCSFTPRQIARIYERSAGRPRPHIRRDLLYSVSQKILPCGFVKFFSRTDGNFLISFYTPIIRSFLH